MLLMVLCVAALLWMAIVAIVVGMCVSAGRTDRALVRLAARPRPGATEPAARRRRMSLVSG